MTRETIEITTISPLHPTTKEELSLLIKNASKRIMEEQNHEMEEYCHFERIGK